MAQNLQDECRLYEFCRVLLVQNTLTMHCMLTMLSLCSHFHYLRYFLRVFLSVIIKVDVPFLSSLFTLLVSFSFHQKTLALYLSFLQTRNLTKELLPYFPHVTREIYYK
jgi:hypothetical protein